jgi:hypothetical protein
MFTNRVEKECGYVTQGTTENTTETQGPATAVNPTCKHIRDTKAEDRDVANAKPKIDNRNLVDIAPGWFAKRTEVREIRLEYIAHGLMIRISVKLTRTVLKC